jgi:hypothetical protein
MGDRAGGQFAEARIDQTGFVAAEELFIDGNSRRELDVLDDQRSLMTGAPSRSGYSSRSASLVKKFERVSTHPILPWFISS